MQIPTDYYSCIPQNRFLQITLLYGFLMLSGSISATPARTLPGKGRRPCREPRSSRRWRSWPSATQRPSIALASTADLSRAASAICATRWIGTPTATGCLTSTHLFAPPVTASIAGAISAGAWRGQSQYPPSCVQEAVWRYTRSHLGLQ